MCGKEFCNAYTELNDPFEQRLRFEEQVGCIGFALPSYIILTHVFFPRQDRRSRVMMKPKESTRLLLTRTLLDMLLISD